jgi:large subunit ribosomal protein L35
MKTHKGAQRRFKVTGTGILMRTKGGKSHLRRKKPQRVKRQYDSYLVMNDADVRRISVLLPYGIP